MGGREKNAVGDTALIGGGLGAALAPRGHKAEGFGRGARRGTHTGVGMGLGGALGLLGGIGTAMATNKLRPSDMAYYAGGGLAGGAALGGLAGYGLSGKTRREPTWEEGAEPMDEGYRDELKLYGTLPAGLLGYGGGTYAAQSAGASPLASLAVGAALGIPAAVFAYNLLDKHLPKSKKPAPGEQPEEKTAIAKLAEIAARG